jgi:hypothetical protein
MSRERITAAGRREILAALLAAEHTVKSAANEAGFEERSAYRWLKDLEFRARIGELRAAMLDRALGKLSDAACDAVDTLVALLAEESPAIRHRAAASILEILGRFKEHVEVDKRLVALEVERASRVVKAVCDNGAFPAVERDPTEGGTQS